MTRDQVRNALVLVAEEIEAAGEVDDLRAVARVYRRAAELVEQMEVRRGPGRPRGATQPAATATRVRRRPANGPGRTRTRTRS